MTAQQKLLAEIEAFIVRNDMTAAQFGREALRDTRFVDRLKEGANPRLDTAERLREFMRRARKPKSKRSHTGAAA